MQYEYFFENGDLPDLDEVCGNSLTSGGGGSNLVGSSSLASSANGGGGDLACSKHQENQTNMLLHNISKIERLTERESGSSAISRTSRFIPQLRKRGGQSNKRSSETYSGDSALVSNEDKDTATRSTANICTKNAIKTNTNTTDTTTSTHTPKYSLITLSTPFTALTKYTLKTICKSTPNISVTNHSHFSNNQRNPQTNNRNKAKSSQHRRSYTTNDRQQHTSKPTPEESTSNALPPACTRLSRPLSKTVSSACISSASSSTIATTSRPTRTATVTTTNRRGIAGLAGIHDIGVTLRLHLQSLDYLKSSGGGGTIASSSSGSGSGSSTTVSSTHPAPKSNHKKERNSFLGQTIHRSHQRKSSLDEKDSCSGSGSGSGSGGSGGSGTGASSINAKDQRNSVDMCSILLTDDESGNSRISDTGNMP